MTTLRKAVAQALDALTKIHPANMSWETGDAWLNAVQILREALAQPEKGPLPVEEIIKIWNDMGNDPIAPSVFSFIACVRKTEQAHGIGEKK